MSEQFWKYAPRSPRHKAVDGGEIRVQLKRSSDHYAAAEDAVLVDLSRHGVRLIAAVEPAAGESVEVRLGNRDGQLLLGLPATVRWCRTEADGQCDIGCSLVNELPWDVLGELFIGGVLDSGGQFDEPNFGSLQLARRQ